MGCSLPVARLASRMIVALLIAGASDACYRTVVPERPDAADASDDVPLVSNIVQLTANTHHTCARRSTGSVECWGDNRDGALGDGTNVNHLTPVRVVGLDDAIDIAAAEIFTCATHTDHTVGCWGTLGATITAVPGGVDAVELCAGERYACARQSSGHVICWNDTLATIEGIDDAVAIGCGFAHACAVRPDGSAVCWGQNLTGTLGNGTYLDGSPRAEPVIGLEHAVAITGGFDTSCGVRSGGDVVCWGSGFLGDGPETIRLVPGAPVRGVSDAIRVAIADVSCLRRAEGSVLCWGRGFGNTLGDGTVDGEHEIPALVPGLNDVVELVAGRRHLCARRRDGEVWCWGVNGSGALGDGTTEDRSTPVRVVGL